MADFPKWLEENKLQDYLAALKHEGCDLEVLTMLNEDQLDQLGSRLDMKMGHQLRLKAAVKRAKLEIAGSDGSIEVASLPPGKRYHYFGEWGPAFVRVFMLLVSRLPQEGAFGKYKLMIQENANHYYTQMQTIIIRNTATAQKLSG